MNQINRVAIFNRAEQMTLNTHEVIALASVALKALSRDRKVLSSCQYCGGDKVYDNGEWYFEHSDACLVETIENIGPLSIEDDDE